MHKIYLLVSAAAAVFSPGALSAQEELQRMAAGQVAAFEYRAPEPSLPKAAAGPADSGFSAVFSDNRDFSAGELSELRGLRVLFVPGFMTAPSLDQSQVLKSMSMPKLPTYFHEQIIFLRSLGIDCGIVNIETEASVSFNADIIAKAVRTSPRKVILIGHSKGGLDVLETLLANPGIRSKVRSVITIQSPFLGSPVADRVLASPVLSYSSAKLLEMMGGSKDSLIDLTVTARKAYHARNGAAISALTAKMPFFAFSTWKSDAPWELDTIMEPFRDYMLSLGLRNDGLVPTDNALLPGARCTVLPELDHVAMVMKVKKPAFDRIRFIRAALKLALKN